MFEDIRDPAARVRALCEYGTSVTVDPAIPPQRYFRSGAEMIRMANVYYDEGDLESAFILYSKFISLFVEKLPKHPEYKTSVGALKKGNTKKLKEVFPKAETIKMKLKDRFTAEENKRLEEERRQAAELARLHELQRQEEERRRHEQEQVLQEEAERRTLQQQQMLIEQEEQLRYLQDLERSKLLAQRLQEEEDQNVRNAAALATVTISDGVPSVPPPSYGSVCPPVQPSVPSRVLKPALVQPTAPPLPPQVDRTTKPDHFTSIGGTAGNQYGLRDIYVPSDITAEFLTLAMGNTSSNKETCGILSGKLSQNTFRVTHMLVPKQSGTPDSCTTENEEELFDYQDKYDLITLGWIHTHPSQTAFLSSVDLHTHCSYQLMLPEAIAIVCAPKFDETGYYSLTPNYGLDYIANCREKGFHPHPKEPPLFEDSSHLKMDTSTRIKVIDLRR